MTLSKAAAFASMTPNNAPAASSSSRLPRPSITTCAPRPIITGVRANIDQEVSWQSTASANTAG